MKHILLKIGFGVMMFILSMQYTYSTPVYLTDTYHYGGGMTVSYELVDDKLIWVSNSTLKRIYFYTYNLKTSKLDSIYVSYGVNPQMTYNGSNYLVVWQEDTLNFLQESAGNMYGKMFKSDFTTIGDIFLISENVSTKFFRQVALNASLNNFIVAYTILADTNYYLYCKFISINKNSIIQSNPIFINSDKNPRDIYVAKDDTNFLILWTSQTNYQINYSYVYGQFIDSKGALVGSTITIDNHPAYSDNPVRAAFDGQRYLIIYHQLYSNKWQLLGRFMDKFGNLSSEFTIGNTDRNNSIPSIVFDGTNYNIAWNEKDNVSASFKMIQLNTQGEVVSPVATILTNFNAYGFLFTYNAIYGYGVVAFNSQLCGPLCLQSSTYYLFYKPDNMSCLADFNYVVNNTDMKIDFSNQSTAGTYFWNFGDGSFSNDSNPSKVYNRAGSYNISLTVKNANCKHSVTKTIQIGENSCNADFHSLFLIDGSLSIQLIDSRDSYNHLWIFGNGTVSSEVLPVFNLTPSLSSGYITRVKHIIKDTETGCTHAVEKIVSMGVGNTDCEAEFNYIRSNNNTIEFINESIGEITKYLWNFNDGNISTQKNPVHTYSKPGIYNVCLTVSNTYGNSDISCKKVWVGIDVQNACLADYDYTINGNVVYFNERSLGAPSLYRWNFGNNETGTGTTISHTYIQNDYYLTSLHISGSQYCKSSSYKLINVGMPNAYKFKFVALVGESKRKAGGYPVDFIGAGLGDEARIRWDFGDGNFDTTSISPRHYYQNPGTYTVCYEVTDPITNTTDRYCQQITVTSIGQIYMQNMMYSVYPNPCYDYINILLHDKISHSIGIRIFDNTGRLLNNYIFDTCSENIKIPIESLQKGLYWIEIRINDNFYYNKIVKK